MKKQKGKFIDDIGRVIFEPDGLIDLIKQGNDLSNVVAIDCNETRLFNKYEMVNKLALYTDDDLLTTCDEYDEVNTNKWYTPKEYNFNDEELITWLLNKCSTDEQYDRVVLELNMYKERNLYPLLNHLIYLIDNFKENGIVWGVGRGSSCSSYILYLIGVHKIDSLLYSLDITEFLR